MLKGLQSIKFFLVLLCTVGAISSCDKDDDLPTPVVNKPDQVFFALSENNQLIQFNAKTAGTATSTLSVTGLQAGEMLMSIDFRPATGQLYGLGNSSRLYVINTGSGVARAIGTTPFTPAVSGSVATIDFNPTVDRIRLVTNTGQNLRLNPETGGVATTDGAINGPANSSVTEVSYTNSIAGASTTILFDIDETNNKLYKQDPPNNGTLVEVGSLNADISGFAGFDISPDNSIALAALNVGGTTGLYGINLDNGNATFYDAFPAGLRIRGLAIPTQPVAYAVDTDNNLLIFNLNSAAVPVSKGITGVQAGEKIVGIDMRPLNGQLYGLGSTGRLYTFNLSSGVAAMVGAAPLVLSGTEFGFDFNPTVDRIRIVSNTGQNLRVNPNDGTLSATDLPLNPGMPMVTGAAYTNNFAGATTTVLFVTDTNNDRLYRQDPPNNGTLVDIGPLGINATNVNGFDIGGTSGTAYAIFTVGPAAGIYTIDVQNGMTTKKSDFSKSVTGFAVGLGF